MQTEADVKADIKSLLTKLKAWHFMPSMNGFGKSGVPDFIVCWAGLFIAIEVKKPGRDTLKDGGCTKWQKQQITEINAAGGIAFVAYSVADVKHIFNLIYERMTGRATWTPAGFINPDGSLAHLSDLELGLPWCNSPSPSLPSQ